MPIIYTYKVSPNLIAVLPASLVVLPQTSDITLSMNVIWRTVEVGIPVRLPMTGTSSFRVLDAR